MALYVRPDRHINDYPGFQGEPVPENNWVPILPHFGDLKSGSCREYYKVLYILRSMGVTRFTLPKGHGGLGQLMRELSNYGDSIHAELRSDHQGRSTNW